MIPALTALLLGLLLGYRWGRQDRARANPWLNARVGDRWSLTIKDDGSTTGRRIGEPLDRDANDRGLW